MRCAFPSAGTPSTRDGDIDALVGTNAASTATETDFEFVGPSNFFFRFAETGEVVIRLLDDSISESDETIVVDLFATPASTSSGQTLSRTVGDVERIPVEQFVITITDDDEPIEPPPPSLLPAIIVTSSVAVVEGTDPTPNSVTTHTLQLTVNNPNAVPVPITWSAPFLLADADTLPGSASTDDVQLVTTSSVVPPGVSVVPVTVLTTADAVVEPSETFVLVPTPGAPNVTVTIVNDDVVAPPPAVELSFFPETSRFREGGEGGGLQVTRRPFTEALELAVTVTDVTTTPDDYEIAPLTLVFAAGQETATVSMFVNDDDLDEPDETFELSFLDGAYIQTVTVLDNDDPPIELTFGRENLRVFEGSEGQGLDITREPFAERLELEVAVVDVTTTPDDYDVTPRTLVFEAGQATATLSIGADDDDVDEADEETFLLSFLDGTFTYTVTVVDNDAPPPPPPGGGIPSFSIGDVSDRGVRRCRRRRGEPDGLDDRPEHHTDHGDGRHRSVGLRLPVGHHSHEHHLRARRHRDPDSDRHRTKPALRGNRDVLRRAGDTVVRYRRRRHGDHHHRRHCRHSGATSGARAGARDG